MPPKSLKKSTLIAKNKNKNDNNDDFNEEYADLNVSSDEEVEEEEEEEVPVKRKRGRPRKRQRSDSGKEEEVKVKIDKRKIRGRKGIVRYGRRKIPMEYINHGTQCPRGDRCPGEILCGGVNRRSVCLSKRKRGIMKKAEELSTLTGCHVALVIRPPKSIHTWGFATKGPMKDIVQSPPFKELLKRAFRGTIYNEDSVTEPMKFYSFKIDFTNVGPETKEKEKEEEEDRSKSPKLPNERKPKNKTSKRMRRKKKN